MLEPAGHAQAATTLHPRSVYTSRSEPSEAPSLDLSSWSRQITAELVAYYRHSLSWVSLLVTAVLLCYVGGAAMFWFHAEYLGEMGPAISWQFHWLLDSTFAFVVLTPALVVLMPLAAWVVTRTGHLHPTAAPTTFALLVGVSFAFLTAPGPIAHNLLLGRGTWLANQVTVLLGGTAGPPMQHEHYEWLESMTQQVGFGLPLYVGLSCLAVALMRMTTARWRLPRGDF